MENATSSKRKRNTAKFYSVRVGHKPGIYQTWEECLSQVKGFKGASYKSFANLTDAERFLDGIDSNQGSTSRHGCKPKYYAVKNGRVPGIYTDWTSAQQQILGWSKPKHKCFATRAEAERFLAEYTGGAELKASDTQQLYDRDYENAKKQKIREDLRDTVASGGSSQTTNFTYDRDSGSSSVCMEDGFDSSIVLDPHSGQIAKKSGLQLQATKLRAVYPKSGSMVQVYTDGSSLGNGRLGACAGIGVYFGPGDSKNVSEPLYGLRQTNQRAELAAIVRALDALPWDQSIEIITDSQYAIKCVTEWHKIWRQNGWKNSAGKPVENRDLVENILERAEQRSRTGAITAYKWTKGHAADPGNIQADKLAVEGARAASQLAAETKNTAHVDE